MAISTLCRICGRPYLHIRKVKGAILYGIFITWGLGMICELIGIYIPNPELSAHSLLVLFLM